MNGEEAGRVEVEDILADDLACAYVFGSTPFNDFDNYDVGTSDLVLIAKEENLAIISMADGLDGPLEGSYVALSHEIDPTSIRKSSQKPSLCCKSRYTVQMGISPQKGNKKRPFDRSFCI